LEEKESLTLSESFDYLTAVSGSKLNYASMDPKVEDAEKSPAGAVTVCELITFDAPHSASDYTNSLCQVLSGNLYQILYLDPYYSVCPLILYREYTALIKTMLSS
jgi:hypothetical protein